MTQDRRRVILVTGSSRGIGAGIVRHFVALGYNAVVPYLQDQAAAESVVASMPPGGGRAEAIQLDVTSETSVQSAFETVGGRHGKLDVLVNNAGVDWPTPIETCSFADWTQITRTKIDGHFLCTKYALPWLSRSDNANLIVIASTLGDRPDPDDPAYSVGTAGSITFMKAMALSLAKHGIRSNAIAAGSVRTELRFWAEQANPDELWHKMAESNPLKRNTRVEDVAQAAAAIVEQRYWNGTIVHVDGGGYLK